MGLLFDSLLMDLLAILLTLLVGLFTYFKWMFTYWEKKGVPYLEPKFPFGNMENPFAPKAPLGFAIKGIYDKLKAQGHKHGGYYSLATPVYIPIDPEFVKNVMQNDFPHFVDRGLYYNEKTDPLSGHLFALGGQKWRRIRTKLTSSFTSGKMKTMFETLLTCSKPMEEALYKLAETNKPVDIKGLVARFTMDVIGSCAFGLDCNSFKNANAEFTQYGRKIAQVGTLRLLGKLVFNAYPELGRFLGIALLPKDSTDFFYGVVKDTMKYRETNNVIRKDMLQLMMDLKNNPDENGKPLTVEEVAAQAFVFFLAGFDTSSTTATFCLYELSSNPKIQDKVRDEINTVLRKHDDKITYEALTEMKYMGQVIDETLRKYPVLPQITRKCVMDYKVPGTDVTIEKGTSVFISALGLHRDPEYYPDPETFDPERFSEENKKQRHPFTYLGFGEGPRMCIGLRFGVMQTKLALTVLLKNFKFSLNEKTEVPLVPHPRNVVFSIRGTIWLNTHKI